MKTPQKKFRNSTHKKLGIELHYILFKSQGYLSTLENMIAPFVFWLNYQNSEILKLGLLDPISYKKQKDISTKFA